MTRGWFTLFQVVCVVHNFKGSQMLSEDPQQEDVMGSPRMESPLEKYIASQVQHTAACTYTDIHSNKLSVMRSWKFIPENSHPVTSVKIKHQRIKMLKIISQWPPRLLGVSVCMCLCVCCTYGRPPDGRAKGGRGCVDTPLSENAPPELLWLDRRQPKPLQPPSEHKAIINVGAPVWAARAKPLEYTSALWNPCLILITCI